MSLEKLGYLEPGVRVFQIIANLTTPLADIPLTPVLVGACYKVVSKENFADQATFTFPFEGGLPSLPPGAILNSDSIVLYVTGKAKIYGGNISGGFAAGNKYTELTLPDSSILQTGDKIEIGGSRGSYTIDYVKGDKIYLNETINHTVDNDATVSIFRDYVDCPVKSGFTVNIQESMLDVEELKAQKLFPFVEGSISVSYTALRQDLSGRYKIKNHAELQDMMETCIKNPLGFLASKSISTNSLYLYVTTDDSKEAIQAAASELSYPGIYYLVPILGGKEIANAYSNYAIAKTQPEIGEFMMAMVCPATEIVKEETIA